mgnify:CR=1 FL=1
MGVERFFSILKRDYNFINDVKPNEKIDCEHLLIDFNIVFPHRLTSDKRKILKK